MANALIKVKDLVKKFGAVTAVDGVSFEINEGECFGLLGPNGAGKTSTIRIIHCVSPATGGVVTVAGLKAHIDDRAIKAMTGVVPQENLLDCDLTVFENMKIFSEFFDIPKNEANLRIDELLAFVELSDKRKAKINELSTGMKRRLMIARALINKPKVIICDEPTTGLDPQARHMIWQRLRSLKSRGATIVLTTQYMEEAEQLCDRIAIMHKGKILKEGTPRKLIKEEIGREVIEVRGGKAEEQKLTEVLSGIKFDHERAGDTFFIYCADGKAIMEKVASLGLQNVLHRPASLEDVFLKLTGRSLIE
jgi:lipooligosaccharide transport system ATP-binding protein